MDRLKMWWYGLESRQQRQVLMGTASGIILLIGLVLIARSLVGGGPEPTVNLEVKKDDAAARELIREEPEPEEEPRNARQPISADDG